MKISPVTFGKKIPLIKCNILDWEEKKSVPALFFEVDCKDKEDLDFIKSLKNLKKYWYYSRSIAENMEKKYSGKGEASKHFYFLKTKDNGIIGISEAEKLNDKIDLYYIETNQSGKFKYAGQSMMASLGKIILKEGKNNFNVIAPAYDAYSFYTKKCGFKPGKNGLLTMPAKKIPKLIRKTELKTHSKILDIEV